MLIFLDKSLQKYVHSFDIDCIKKGLTYKDFALSYSKLTLEQKDKLASLLSNQ